MSIIELQLDEQTLERARSVAKRRHATVETLIAEIIGLLAGAEGSEDPLLGMFSQQPDLVDEVVQAAMSARETDPLRVSNG
jgi:hypothetical protein